MGMFENHAQVQHPTCGWDLQPQCTACKNTGWVVYPVNVTIGIDEYDECPNGCRQMSDNERRDYYVKRQPIPLDSIPAELHDAYFKSLQDTYWADPFIKMTQGPRTRSLVGWKYTEGPKPRGRVTTDVPVMGLAEGLGGHVYPCTVPEYLAGKVIDATPLTVRYEYLGSSLTVRFHASEASFFRFAHQWDDGFETSELL